MEKDDRRCPRGKLHCCNWLDDIPAVPGQEFDIVEVVFKNTRKGFYRNSLGLDIEVGDLIAVEASPGHDIGVVSLKGPLVAVQMKRAGIKNENDVRRVFRKARPADIEKYEEARARENDTMIRARKIAEDLKLNMKIGDVEFQGDGNKAIFYYIADERVDFRQLIKVLADTFKVRIEMKQIGARQEAGRIGGIGSCGRPLCCASWMTNFVSVGTSAARYQDISLNPQKLAGQCAKLKCCLNFEVDTYVESARHLPEKNIRLETADSTYFHFKTDIFKKEITYSTDKQMAANLVTIDAARAFEVIEMNKRGEKPLRLQRDGEEKEAKPRPIDLAAQDDLTRFDRTKKKKKKKAKNSNAGNAAAAEGTTAQQSQQPQQTRQGEGKKRKPKNNNDRKPAADESAQQPQQSAQRGNEPAQQAQGTPGGNEANENKPRRNRNKKPKGERKPAADQGSAPVAESQSQSQSQNQPQSQSQSQSQQSQQPVRTRTPKAFRAAEGQPDNQENRE